MFSDLTLTYIALGSGVAARLIQLFSFDGAKSYSLITWFRVAVLCILAYLVLRHMHWKEPSTLSTDDLNEFIMILAAYIIIDAIITLWETHELNQLFKNRGAESELEDTNLSLRRCNMDLATERQRRETCEGRLTATGGYFEDCQKKLTEEEDRVDKLTGELTKCNKKAGMADELRRKNKQQTEALSSVRGELGKTRAELKKTTGQYDETRDKLGKSQASVKRLSKDLRNARATLNECSNDYDKEHKRLAVCMEALVGPLSAPYVEGVECGDSHSRPKSLSTQG